MHIRLATAADAPALARLLEEFNGPTVTPQQVTSRLQACQGLETTLLAEVEGRAVGFACLRLVPSMSGDTPYAELTEIYVQEAHRRHGIGRALMARAEALAQRQGATHLILLTGFKNLASQAFYRALGYADYALAMRKRLEL